MAKYQEPGCITFTERAQALVTKLTLKLGEQVTIHDARRAMSLGRAMTVLLRMSKKSAKLLF